MGPYGAANGAGGAADGGAVALMVSLKQLEAILPSTGVAVIQRMVAVMNEGAT